ncbi:Y-family DNA polymerase [Primorskyibacter sp. S187A]|uniref:Y-family DNA polymerase n=1 Tax=Primorskyibacter sp. S187A TaxID=3415130 RepID=UPI003C7A1B70
MPQRRILSLWFPRLGAERLLRQMRGDAQLFAAPLAIIDRVGNRDQISSLSPAAAEAGLQVGFSLRDACAICPELVTRRRNPHIEARFLGVLQRWAGRFSPWVTRDGEDGLLLDVTGCTHLFGGEEQMVAQLADEGHAMGVSVHAGLADTRGAAWALARFAGQSAGSDRSGDAIDMEARATRSRAAKRRHWERGGSAVSQPSQGADTGQSASRGRIAPPGQTHSALAALPITGLRLESDTTAALTRLGLRQIGDLVGQPRAALARRFGKAVVLRLDQALGAAPEPVSPAAPEEVFALRLTLPDPIGLVEDVTAAIDRLLPPLCEKLRSKGKAARGLVLEAHRADHTMQRVHIRLARPSHTPARLRGLLLMKLDDIDAGFGIDMLRLVASEVEVVQARTQVGHGEAGRAVAARLEANTALDDLIGRIGARVGLERVTRRVPAQSHLPEKCANITAAAFSEAATTWPAPARPRPLRLWRPEPVDAPDMPRLPEQFRWRRRHLTLAHARGPERIAPEWWLDAPEWRSGQRDYWDVVTEEGERLWLFYAHGAEMSSGWFCHGSFM